MKIAICSDELHPVNDFVIKEIERFGHMAVVFGALKSHQSESWVQVAKEAARSVKKGDCDEGIFFCWTGTGVSIVANKIPGIRAALCVDAQTAKGARLWNGANVLVLSNRLTTEDLAKEILAAWFNTSLDAQSQTAIQEISAME